MVLLDVYVERQSVNCKSGNCKQRNYLKLILKLSYYHLHHNNSTQIQKVPLYVSRSRQDEEDDGHDGYGLRDENGGNDPAGHRWSIRAGWQGVNRLQGTFLTPLLQCKV